MKILLVGGGITSAVTGMCLRKLLPESHLSMWDKARGTGGRMSTTRCPLSPECIADLGAQYITTTDDVISFNNDVYNDLISDGILEPLKCNIVNLKPQGNNKNFVIPRGASNLVKHFLNKAKLNETRFAHHIASINKEKDKWVVETKTGEKDNFDVVILTMPVPQLFLLEGSIKTELNLDLISKLTSVTYSSRYVLVLFFLENLNEKWGAQYLNNDPIFRYVAIDNVKRNKPDDLCAVVFHTTVGFGLKNVEESIPDIEKVLLDQAKSLFPNWPEPKSVKCHKWRYSQVTTTYPETPGCLVLSTTPPLLIGGDAFVGSTFDNCVKSAKTMCDNIKQLMKR